MNTRPFDLHFLCRCVTSGSSCTRCVCPQNQINEITSVPSGCWWPLNPEDAVGSTSSSIGLQRRRRRRKEQPGEYWCRTDVREEFYTSSGRHLLLNLLLISERSVLRGSKLSSDLKETEICAVLSASTVLQPADDSRFTSCIRPNESTTRLTGTQQREWCGQHGRAEEAQDKRCTDLSVISQDRAACWQRCGGSYVTAENPGFKSIPVTPYYCYYCYYGMSISRSVT